MATEVTDGPGLFEEEAQLIRTGRRDAYFELAERRVALDRAASKFGASALTIARIYAHPSEQASAALSDARCEQQIAGISILAAADNVVRAEDAFHKADGVSDAHYHAHQGEYQAMALEEAGFLQAVAS